MPLLLYIVPFQFGVWGKMSNLIISVTDHYFFVYISVECSPGWEPDDKEGCRQCDFGYYKSKSGNINCTQCGMAGPIRRVTEQRESKAKVDCVSKYTYEVQINAYMYHLLLTKILLL